MSTEKPSKLNRLLGSQPMGTVLTSSWLKKHGYSLDLQKQYRRSGWFISIGTGAMMRSSDQVDYVGGVYALQTQLGLSVHPAAHTSLSLQGKAHYLELGVNRVQLFGGLADKLPVWFKKREWGVKLDYTATSFLPPTLGLVEHEHKNFKIMISGPARAIMECLYLTPQTRPLMESYELLEGMNNLRPVSVQKLLEGCTSVKVKRLFLYFAEKVGHEWFNHLKLEHIDLGSGKRVIAQGGVYDSKYRITVPKELEANCCFRTGRITRKPSRGSSQV